MLLQTKINETIHQDSKFHFFWTAVNISVLNYPTYVTIAKLLNIKQNNIHNPSKTLTVANQTEVPILHMFL